MNKKILIFGIVMVLLSGIVSGYNPTEDLNAVLNKSVFLSLSFDENPAPSPLTDATGVHSLSKIGSVTSNADSIVNRSFYFDGSDDYYRDLAGFQLGDISDGSFSGSLWVKNALEQGTGEDFVFMNHGSTTDRQWGLYYDEISGGDRICFYLDFYSQEEVCSSIFNEQEWHHVAFIYNQTTNTRALYIDGVKDENYTDNINYGGTSSEFVIGANTDQSDDFKGYIDEFIIWDRVLSEEEVIELYNRQLSNTSGSQYPFIYTYENFTVQVGNVNLFNVSIDGINYQGVDGLVITHILANDTNNYNITVSKLFYYDAVYIDYNVSTPLILNLTAFPLPNYTYVYNPTTNEGATQQINIQVEYPKQNINEIISSITYENINYTSTRINGTLNSTWNYYNFTYDLVVPLQLVNHTYDYFNVSYIIDYVNETTNMTDTETKSFYVDWVYYPTSITVTHSNLSENSYQTVDCQFTEESGTYSFNYTLNDYNTTALWFSNYSDGFGGLQSTYLTPPLSSGNQTHTIYCTMDVDGYERNITTTYINYNFGFSVCGVGETPFLTFVGYDEKTREPLNTDISILIDYGVGEGNYTLGYNGTGQANYSFCADPSFISFTFNSISLHKNDDYGTRSYYYLSETINDGSEIIPIYLLNESIVNLFQVTVYDTYLNEIDGAYVKLLRYDIATDSYSLVQVEKSVAGIVNLQLEEDTYYKIIIVYNGETKKETSSFKYSNTDVYYVIDTDDDQLDGWKLLESDISVTDIIYDNVTNMFSFSWTSTNGAVSYGCIEVYRQNSVYGEELLGTDCEFSDSATVFVTLATVLDDNEYYAIAKIDTNTEHSIFIIDEFVLSTKEDWQLFGIEGLLATILLIVGLAGILAFDGTLVIVGVLIGLISTAMFGIINLPIGIVVGIVILGATIIITKDK